MNMSKNVLLLLSAFFVCFITIHCSEIPSFSAKININEIVKVKRSDPTGLIVSNVRGVGHNGPYLPDNFFGSYKLIRPLPRPYLDFHLNYDLLLYWGYFSYWLSKTLKNPKIFRCVSLGLVSFFAIFHLPSLFGFHWVASIKNSARTQNDRIADEIESIDEIFLAEGIMPFDLKECFPFYHNLYLNYEIAQKILDILRLSRFRR